MKNLLNKKNLILFIPLIIIMVISFLTMYNSKFVSLSYSNHLTKQIIWYSLFFLIIILNRKIKILFKYSNFIYILNVILLILVLIFGNSVNGAKAWFNFGFISFQPSELMKLSYSLFLTKLISNYKHKSIKSDFLFLLKILFIFLIPSILIFLEPDTGAIIFLLIITLCMLLLSDIKKIWFILIFLLPILLLLTFLYLYFFKQDLLIDLIGTSFFYRMDRIINFNSIDNIQLQNSLIAIGNANFFGTGLGKATIYIPEIATDFAFSLTVSSFGFFTSLILIICYFLIDLYFFSISFNIKNKTTRLFTSGFIGVFIFSQLYNILMNIGFLPIMGIPLPLLSYGGSSLIVIALYISIILKIDFNNI